MSARDVKVTLSFTRPEEWAFANGEMFSPAQATADNGAATRLACCHC